MIITLLSYLLFVPISFFLAALLIGKSVRDYPDSRKRIQYILDNIINDILIVTILNSWKYMYPPLTLIVFLITVIFLIKFVIISIVSFDDLGNFKPY